MAQTTTTQRVLNQLFTTLKTRYSGGEQAARPVLEQLVYAICREGATREKADVAFRNLNERFIDWNEVRVSSPHEVEEAMKGLPDPEVRAHRLLSVLQEVFETTFSFDLEPLQKKGLKLAAKQLARYQAVSDFVVAWVVHYTMDGDTIPLDAPTLRVLRRTGLIDSENDDCNAIRNTLGEMVPKSRIPLFCDVVGGLADEFCVDGDPDCENCPLSGDCPTGRDSRETVPATRGSRQKPR